MKNEIFFSRIRKWDVDMIWDHDRYVKTSPGSTLQSFNDGLTISHDLGRKSGMFCCSKEICCKKRISNFFEKRRNLMSRLKISSWNVSEWKEHIRNILTRCWLKYDFWKNEIFFLRILLAFFKPNFNQKTLIKSLRKKFHFFKSHISTSIFQVCFECALSVPKHFRTIFST